MPLITFPKHRKKLPHVKTPSSFTSVKVYFQPPFPCPVISNISQKKTADFLLSSAAISDKQLLEGFPNTAAVKAQQKPWSHHHTHIPVFRWFLSGQAQPLCPCSLFMLKTTERCTMPGAHLFFFCFVFSTWFAAEQTLPRTDILFERWPQMHGFHYCKMSPFHFIICIYWEFVFSRTNRLSLIVESCILLHGDKNWSACTSLKPASGKEAQCGFILVAGPAIAQGLLLG